MAGERSRDIVEVYSAQQANLIAELLRVLLGMWVPFLWWRSPDLVAAQSAGTAARVDIALGQMRRLARVYASQMAMDLDVPVRNLPRLEELHPRSGRAIVEVYERPAKQFIRELSTGKTVDEATDAAIERLERIVTADMMATARDEVNKVFDALPEVIGYRRLIHPERSASGTCGLCVVAATQFYTKERLMALHDNCKCTQAPITKDADPGFTLNREDLDAIYAAAGSSLAEDLKRTRVAIREHGELGPILVREGQHFRDVADVNRDRKPATPKFKPYSKMSLVEQLTMWDAMKSSSERAIERLNEARLNGESRVALSDLARPVEIRDVEQAIRYHQELIARANAHLL